jgi:cyclase
MLRKLGLILLVGILIAAAYGYRVWRNVHTLEVEAVTDSVSVIFGVGGNVGVLRTDFGPVVVDTLSLASQGAVLREMVEDIGGGPTVALINTHYHLDHTHGNPAWPSGTRVIATSATRRHLQEDDGDYWTGEAASLLPGSTFDGVYRVELGGHPVSCYYFGRGHTDGDLVVLFEKERVLHTGDLFFNGRFPNIDLEAGGSVKEWVATLDEVLKLDFDHIIPGHGPVATREELVGFQSFLRELWGVGQKAAEEGWTLEETQERARLRSAARMEDFVIPFIVRLDRPFVLRRVWEEATGAVAYTPPPAPAS